MVHSQKQRLPNRRLGLSPVLLMLLPNFECVTKNVQFESLNCLFDRLLTQGPRTPYKLFLFPLLIEQQILGLTFLFNDPLNLLRHHHLLLLCLLGSTLLLLFLPLFEVVSLINLIVMVQNLLELSVSRLLDGLHGYPSVPDGLQALIGKLFDEVVGAFLVSVVLEASFALFPEFIKRLSKKSLVHFSENRFF